MLVIACATILLLGASSICAQNNNNNNGNNLPTCQCFTFDPCVARERARFEQCSLRTCPSQVFDQLHQDWIACWNDSPQLHNQFSACIDQQAGKSCTAFATRHRRQATNYYNYYQQYQALDDTGDDVDFSAMMTQLKGAADQWQAYGDCINTCMNSTGQLTKRDTINGPLKTCARQLNCKLQQWDWERLSSASATCRRQLNIDWKTQIMNKCTCFERLDTMQPACSDVQGVLNDMEGSGIEDLLDNVVAFFGTIMNNDKKKK